MSLDSPSLDFHTYKRYVTKGMRILRSVLYTHSIFVLQRTFEDNWRHFWMSKLVRGMGAGKEASTLLTSSGKVQGFANCFSQLWKAQVCSQLPKLVQNYCPKAIQDTLIESTAINIFFLQFTRIRVIHVAKMKSNKLFRTKYLIRYAVRFLSLEVWPRPQFRNFNTDITDLGSSS